MDQVVKQYGDIVLSEIRADNAEELAGIGAGLIRAELPSRPDNIISMLRQGYVFGDRTIGVSINLGRMQTDLSRTIRFDVHNADLSECREDILRIAKSSFPTDRRFHVRPIPDQGTADKVITSWVDGLTNIYVCMHKDRIVGFIDVEPVSDDTCFIHLAAVEERYRAAGAAVSMYAYAVKTAKEQGYAHINGRISSTNTAVMNLYSFLGATFSDPIDVFLREE